ncbi:MAG: hypothetical protein MI923_01140 [Phycisphaerales bacterium]|nr:hypothetical protein [Phycisphaerales bacterium]
MSTDEFSNVNLADGKITEVKGLSGDVEVVCIDWEEKRLVLTFKDVIGLHAFSPEEVDLSHVVATRSDPEIQHAIKVAEEESTGQTCYKFVSAWSESSVLTIIAQDVAVAS